MRVALIADIHGNAHALSAVLRAAREAGADRLLVAGDLVGYYYRPKEVLELLDGWRWDAVRGNHEDMLADWRRGIGRDAVRARYGHGLEVACRDLTPGALDALCGLPRSRRLEIGGRSVLLCHGSPEDTDDYVYPDSGREAQVVAAGAASMVVHGHTHHPHHWRDAEGRRLVNPGSVGQPRDRRPGACWALWDCTEDNIDLRREPYDMEPVLADCRAHDPDLPYLTTVLTRTAGAGAS